MTRKNNGSEGGLVAIPGNGEEPGGEIAPLIVTEANFCKQIGGAFMAPVADYLLMAVEYAYNQYAQNNDAYPPSLKEGKQLSWYEPFESKEKCCGFTGLITGEGIEEGEEPILIALRGTEGVPEWISDLDFFLKKIGTKSGKYEASVHSGFWNTFAKPGSKSLQCQIQNQVKTLLTENKNRDIYITGHSLGAAVTALITVDIGILFPNNNLITYNFASPRVGDDAFANIIDTFGKGSARQVVYWRVVNTSDLVPELPPSILGKYEFEHTNSFPYPPAGVKSYVGSISFTNNLDSLASNHAVSTYRSALHQLFSQATPTTSKETDNKVIKLGIIGDDHLKDPTLMKALTLVAHESDAESWTVKTGKQTYHIKKVINSTKDLQELHGVILNTSAIEPFAGINTDLISASLKKGVKQHLIYLDDCDLIDHETALDRADESIMAMEFMGVDSHGLTLIAGGSPTAEEGIIAYGGARVLEEILNTFDVFFDLKKQIEDE